MIAFAFSKDSWRIVFSFENGILLSVTVATVRGFEGGERGKKERWEGIRRVVADVDTAEIVQNIEITRVVHARLGENRDNLVLGAANETGFLQPPFVGRIFFFLRARYDSVTRKLLRKFLLKLPYFSLFFPRVNERRKREIENKKYLIRTMKLHIWMKDKYEHER